MKKIFFILVAILLISNSWAYSRPLSLGLMLGNPIGVNGKYQKEESKAIDGGIGVSPGNEWVVSLHSDYLWFKNDFLFFKDQYPLDLYYGVGGRMEFADTIEFGPRLPIGVQSKDLKSKSELFLEMAPILDFLGRFGIELSLAVGARYHF